jgi:hypothetical protein
MILHPVDATFCYNMGGTRMPPDPRDKNHKFSSRLFALPLSPHCSNQQQWHPNQ